MCYYIVVLLHNQTKMKKLFLILFMLLCTCTLFAQEIERVVIQGHITADADEMVSGIHIYNISSQKGTITNEEGDFEIAVAKNDRLEITAIQFKGYTVIVTAKAIERKTMVLYLNPAINTLDEVFLKDHDLTGVLKEDVSNIKTYVIDTDFDTSYEGLEDSYEFAPDGQTAVQGNAAEEALGNPGMENGFNFIAVAALAVKLILGPPKNKPNKIQIDTSNDTQIALLNKKFDDVTLQNSYGIGSEYATDFRYFLIESVIPSSYLLPDNQLLLFEYVQSQSSLYLEQIKE
ncbi:MAG: hypothetical protein ACI849_000189 [Patiriisocius sp.]